MKGNTKRYILVGVLILAMIAFILPSILPPPGSKKPSQSSSTYQRPSAPAGNESGQKGTTFIDDGDLYFINDGDTLTQIEIEIADTRERRQQGLMFRPSMKDDHGMLFVFPQSQPQSFWMKNTYIPLDMLFIDADGKIVQVTQKISPTSENSISCPASCRYVLEVNSGFTAAYGIKSGQTIAWKRG